MTIYVAVTIAIRSVVIQYCLLFFALPDNIDFFRTSTVSIWDAVTSKRFNDVFLTVLHKTL